MSSINTFLLLFLLTLAPATFAAKKCEAGLVGSRPDRKTLGVGALLELRSNLKTVGAGFGVIDQVPTDELHLFKSLMVGSGGWRILPGMQLRTLGPYKKIEGIAVVEVEVPGTGIRGFMYWTDLYRNTLVIEEGTPVVNKVRKAVAKFPEKCRPPEEWDELKSQGQTTYGRPYGSIGDLVWIENHTRSMSSKTVGWIRRIEKSGSHTMAVVETLSGATRESELDRCSRLTADEVAEWTGR